MVKIFASDAPNPLFPNDPESEACILRHLDGLNIAPRLLDHFDTPAGYCIVYTHVSGKPWRIDPTIVAAVLYLVHQIKAPDGFRHAPHGSTALKEQTLRILARCPADQTHNLRALEPSVEFSASAHETLLHGDPVPANIIVDGANVRLIDWQCPAIGDPCEDIAIFLSPAMQLGYRGSILNSDDVAEFLNAYPDQNIAARYRAAAPWYHWRMAAYCLWKKSIGEREAEEALNAELNALELATS